MLQINNYLDRQFEEAGESARSVALYGPGGVGKTQVAIAYAFESRSEKRYSAVFWASAISRQTYINDLNKIAEFVFPKLPSTDPEITAAMVKEELETELKLRSWLLIIDNVDNLDLIRDLLPFGASRGTIFVTTRYAPIAKICRNYFYCDTLPPEAAAQFLIRASHSSPAETQVANVVASELGCFPLALEQAAAFVRETENTLLEYLDQYKSQKAELLDRRVEQPLPALEYYKQTVFTSMSISVASVSNQSAVSLLNLLSFFSPGDIPEQMLQDGAAGLSDATLHNVLTDIGEARKSLLDFSLIRRLTGSNSLWMHVLLQEVVRHKLQNEQLEWASRMIQVVSAAFPNLDDCLRVAIWPTCRRYIPHVLLCLEYSKLHLINSAEAAKLFQTAAFYLSHIGMYETAQPLAEQSFQIWKHVGEELKALETLNDIGILHYRQRRYDRAERTFEEARTISEQKLGLRHPFTARVLSCLSNVYDSRDEHTRCHELRELAISIFRESESRLEGRLRIGFGSALGNMGDSYLIRHWRDSNSRALQEALKYITEAQQIFNKEIGRDHPERGRNLIRLAHCHRAQGRVEDALKELTESRLIIMAETRLQEEDAIICEILRDIFWEQDAYDNAVAYGLEAVELVQQAYGRCDIQTVTALNALAGILFKDKQYPPSKYISVKAIELLEDESFAVTNRQVADLETRRRHYLTESHCRLGMAEGKEGMFLESEAAFGWSIHHDRINAGEQFTLRQLGLQTMLTSVYLRTKSVSKFRSTALLVLKECCTLKHAVTALSTFLNNLEEAYSKWAMFDADRSLRIALRKLCLNLEHQTADDEDETERQKIINMLNDLVKHSSKSRQVLNAVKIKTNAWLTVKKEGIFRYHL
jgi:tetratricopeptide (TPR) repeat protein